MAFYLLAICRTRFAIYWSAHFMESSEVIRTAVMSIYIASFSPAKLRHFVCDSTLLYTTSCSNSEQLRQLYCLLYTTVAVCLYNS